MKITTASALTVGTIALAAALTGCATTASGGTASTTPPAAPATTTAAEPTPSPTSEPTTAAPPVETTAAPVLPTSCDELGTEEHRAATIGQLQEQPAPTLKNDVLPADSLVLGCSWFGGDVTSATYIIAQPDEQSASKAMSALVDGGYTCNDTAGYPSCEHSEDKDFSGNAYTISDRVIYRDGVWLSARSSNLDVSAITDDVIASIWP